jgi:hypothetical protein
MLELYNIVATNDEENIELLNKAIVENNMTHFNQFFPLVLMKAQDNNFPHISLLFGNNYYWSQDKSTMFNLLFDSMHYRDSQKQKERDFTEFLRFAGKYFGYHSDLNYLSDFLNMAQKFITHTDLTQLDFQENIIHIINNYGFHCILPLLENDFKDNLNYFKAFMNYACIMDDSERGLVYLKHLTKLSEEKVTLVLNSPSEYNAEHTFLLGIMYICSDKIFQHLIELGARFNNKDMKHINESLMKHDDIAQKMDVYFTYLEKENLETLITQNDLSKKQFKL